MNITDETAKFLLTRNPNDWSQVYDADYPTQGSDASMGNSIRVPDLQRMARLWLMRDEIVARLQRAYDSDCYQEDYRLLQELKALDSNDAREDEQ